MQTPLGVIREMLGYAGEDEQRAVSHLSSEAAAVVLGNSTTRRLVQALRRAK